MNIRGEATQALSQLGLTPAEAKIYVELLKQPATHAQLSEQVSINRTTLYRIVKKLQKQGLVTARVDDRGKFLTAASPEALEVEVVNQEIRTQHQRAALSRLLPALESLQHEFQADFAVQVYEGVAGFKRMLWHELKTQSDCLCIGAGVLEDLILSHEWAEEHRRLSTQAGYQVREIGNPGSLVADFTVVSDFMGGYEQRIIPRSVLAINYMITTYNDTVAIYHMNQGHRRGLEIISQAYAETIRSMFELCWQAAASAPVVAPISARPA